MSDIAMRPLRELVEAHRDEIRAIVARHHGRSVAIFGSVARGDERAGSDIDFLVELEPDARPFEILSIGVELESALGVKVDVGTPDSLRERLRDDVLAEAVPLRAGRTSLYDAVRVRIEIGEAVKASDPIYSSGRRPEPDRERSGRDRRPGPREDPNALRRAPSHETRPTSGSHS